MDSPAALCAAKGRECGSVPELAGMRYPAVSNRPSGANPHGKNSKPRVGNDLGIAEFSNVKKRKDRSLHLSMGVLPKRRRKRVSGVG
jgi:hypothetical protein